MPVLSTRLGAAVRAPGARTRLLAGGRAKRGLGAPGVRAGTADPGPFSLLPSPSARYQIQLCGGEDGRKTHDQHSKSCGSWATLRVTRGAPEAEPNFPQSGQAPGRGTGIPQGNSIKEQGRYAQNATHKRAGAGGTK